MPTFIITGLYHTETLNDRTLPPIEVEANDELDAILKTGVTVWTKEQWDRSPGDDPTWPKPIKYPAT